MTWPAPMKRQPTSRDYRAKVLYESGELPTVAAVAAWLGLSKAQARIRLHRVGAKMRPRGHQVGAPMRKVRVAA